MKREDLLMAPQVLKDFLIYHETIAGHSKKTSDEYFLDLRLFFRFLRKNRGEVSPALPLEEIPIFSVDGAFLRTITLNEVYDFIRYLGRDRPNGQHEPGLGSAARARKIAAIRSFFKYLAKSRVIEDNPMKELESPRQKKALPRYLTERESLALLDSVAGQNAERDYAILTLFLNCGLRRSELAGLNLADVEGETVRVLGKGNKERILYQNEACIAALESWKKVRPEVTGEKALFLSGTSKTGKHQRIHPSTIHALVKKRLLQAGLDPERFSSHKLRHTAATLMLQNGVDVRTLQEVLGHEHLNTTQIYTHVDNAELRLAARANPLSKVKKKE
ncbi:MAG: tyrosine-type recombinase/integrase [Oscillospiraceae bacterium]|jgi:site-specific recombinase XerD|nr:tyrosine-type recombinase/integrase [Oscillospiraceae bacterium]